jgi:hypothetical protein
MFSWFPLLFPIRQPVAVQVRFHVICLVTFRRQLQSSEHCSSVSRNAVFSHFDFAGWFNHRGVHVALRAGDQGMTAPAARSKKNEAKLGFI